MIAITNSQYMFHLFKKERTDNLFNINRGDKKEVIENIIEDSSPRKSFFVMITASAIICSVGIAQNNAAVIIGGMLLAPMLSPILAISLGIALFDIKLLLRSIRVTFWGFLAAFVFSYLTVLLIDIPETFNHEMTLRIVPNIESLIVAIVAGVGGTLSLIKKELQKFLVGIAIAVALIPPISMGAIALRMLEFPEVYSSLANFLINLFGITISSLFIFLASKIYTSRKVADKELKEEAEILNNKE